MAATGVIFAAALAFAAGRLILWTSLRRGSAHACTLQAVRDPAGTLEYAVAPLGLRCRGDVVVRHAQERALGRDLLRRLRGRDPLEAVQLLRAEGLAAELMPGVHEGSPARAGAALPVAARARRHTAE